MAYTDNDRVVTVPAGEYIVGDPCYTVPDAEWMDWLEAANYTETNVLVANMPNGHLAVGFGTAFGDGVYEDQKGNSYPVDAGLIGLVAVEGAEGFRSDLSRKVTFNVPTDCFIEREGDSHIIVLGDIRIQTGDVTDMTECIACGQEFESDLFTEYCEDCKAINECSQCGEDLDGQDSYADLCASCADKEYENE